MTETQIALLGQREQVVAGVNQALLNFRTLAEAELSSIAEHDLKEKVKEAFSILIKDSDLPEVLRAEGKRLDEIRKAYKRWKVEYRKKGESLQEIPKESLEWIKEKTAEGEQELLSAEKHIEGLQKKIEAKEQALINGLNERLTADFAAFGFELVPASRMLRYAGNRVVAIDGLYKLSQKDVDDMCDAHELWASEQAELLEKQAQKAKSIRDMTLRLFIAEILPTIPEDLQEKAKAHYEGSLAYFSDQEAISNPTFGEAVYSLFSRDFVIPKPKEIEQLPIVEVPEEAFEGKESAAASVGEIAEAALGLVMAAVEEISKELPETASFGGTVLVEPTQEEIEARKAVFAKAIDMAQSCRIKPGNQDGTIVFDDLDFTNFCKANGVFSPDEDDSYYGGVLFAESTPSAEIRDQIIVQWNAMAPPRSGRTSKGRAK